MKVSITKKSILSHADMIVSKFPSLSKSNALEAIAIGLGFKNFDTLSGVLKKEQVPTCPHLRKHFWVEMYSVSDFGETPGWVCFEMTTKLWSVLISAKNRLLDSDLELALDEQPDFWPEMDGYGSCLNMKNWRLHVTSDRFWFSASPKHTNYRCETRSVYFEDTMALSNREPYTVFDSKHIVIDSTDAKNLIASILNDNNARGQKLFDQFSNNKGVDLSIVTLANLSVMLEFSSTPEFQEL